MPRQPAEIERLHNALVKAKKLTGKEPKVVSGVRGRVSQDVYGQTVDAIMHGIWSDSNIEYERRNQPAKAHLKFLAKLASMSEEAEVQEAPPDGESSADGGSGQIPQSSAAITIENEPENQAEEDDSESGAQDQATGTVSRARNAARRRFWPRVSRHLIGGIFVNKRKANRRRL